MSVTLEAPRPNIRLPNANNSLGVEDRSPEKQELVTPNLLRLKGLIAAYDRLTAPRANFDLQKVNEALAKYETGAWDLVNPQGTVIREEKITSTLSSFRSKKHSELYPSYPQPDSDKTQETPDQKVERNLKEFDEILEIEAFIRGTIDMYPRSADYSRVLENLGETINFYKASALIQIIRTGGRLFKKDAALASGLPVGNLNDDDQNNSLAYEIRKLAMVVSSPDLKDVYAEAVNPLKAVVYSYFPGVHSPKIWDVLDWVRNQEDAKKSAIRDIINNFRGPDWKDLQATPEQASRLYDLVHHDNFDLLNLNGEDPSRSAAWIFRAMGDPRAIPGLLNYLRTYRTPPRAGGAAVEALNEILENPTSQEALKVIKSGLSRIDKEIIDFWLLNPPSWLKRFVKPRGEEAGIKGSTLSHYIGQAPRYLALTQTADFAVQISSVTGKEIGYEALNNFIYQSFYGEAKDEITPILIAHLPMVAPLIVRYGMSDLRQVLPRLFNSLVNPEAGDITFFPKIIAKEGLGLSQENVTKLEQLYQSRDLTKGVMARVSFAEGLLYLVSKPNGGQIMDAILKVANNSREEPTRIRQIFRLFQSLETLDAFGFTPKGSTTEIVEDLRRKIIVAVKDKMELSDQELTAIEQSLQVLTENGTLEIIPILLSNYQRLNRPRTTGVTREIGRHIVLGDFREWRNNLDTSQAQLSVLPTDQVHSWITPTRSVSTAMGIQSGKEARQGAVDAIGRIVAEAKAHIQEVYKLDFSSERIRVLVQQQSELLDKLKSNITNEEKRDLGESKRAIDNELKVIEGLNRLGSLKPEDLDPTQVLNAVSKIVAAMETFQGLEQPAQDLNQITEVLTTQRDLTTVTQLRAYDTDDPLALLKVGTEPRETCQSWRKGSFNYCLPAYVTDANKRAFNVEDDKGAVVARSIGKLTHRRVGEEEKRRIILFQPVYTTSEIAPIYRAMARLVLNKAEDTGSEVVLRGQMNVQTGADHQRSIPVLLEEARKRGFTVLEQDVEVFTPTSFNDCEYDDLLGGVITNFNTYKELNKAVVIIPPQQPSI